MRRQSTAIIRAMGGKCKGEELAMDGVSTGNRDAATCNSMDPMGLGSVCVAATNMEIRGSTRMS